MRPVSIHMGAKTQDFLFYLDKTTQSPPPPHICWNFPVHTSCLHPFDLLPNAHYGSAMAVVVQLVDCPRYIEPFVTREEDDCERETPGDPVIVFYLGNKFKLQPNGHVTGRINTQKLGKFPSTARISAIIRISRKRKSRQTRVHPRPREIEGTARFHLCDRYALAQGEATIDAKTDRMGEQ